MNIHQNARLTPLGRERIVMQVLCGQSPQAASRAAGVCPRTVHKWMERFKAEGAAGLKDLETSAPGIFAAGDIARWPDPHSSENIRVEHWVVAERQGQTTALNMLGHRERFSAVPFSWSQHCDIPINYVGHAENWDEVAIEGDIAARDCLLRFKRNGNVLAVASIFRDVESLRAEVSMEWDTPA